LLTAKIDVETRQAGLGGTSAVARRWFPSHLGDFLFKIPAESFDADGGAYRHSSTTKKIGW